VIQGWNQADKTYSDSKQIKNSIYFLNTTLSVSETVDTFPNLPSYGPLYSLGVEVGGIPVTGQAVGMTLISAEQGPAGIFGLGFSSGHIDGMVPMGPNQKEPLSGGMYRQLLTYNTGHDAILYFADSG